jgi:hypothetical protein
VSPRAKRSCLLVVSLLGGAAILTACNDDTTTVSTAPPVPNSTDFTTYAQALVTRYSCDNNPAVPINNIDFTFAADQDMVPADDIDMVTAACAAG